MSELHSAEANLANEEMDQDKQHLDDYMDRLWIYNEENPDLGMHKPAELKEIFSRAEFDFNPGAYQAGELIYLSHYGSKLIYGMQAERLQAEQNRRKALKDEGLDPDKVEKTAAEQEKDDKIQELMLVTSNRLSLIHKGLSEWIKDLSSLYYYKSNYTNFPYIDGRGRIFLFITKPAIEKATIAAEKSKDFSLEHTENISNFLSQLYLNACDVVVFNDGSMPFEAALTDIFAPFKLEEKYKDQISDNNRALRYFILAFHQVALAAGQEDSDEEENQAAKEMALTQLEAQITARLIQANAYFTLSPASKDQLQFVVVADESGRKALSCFLDKGSVPEHKENSTETQYKYEVMPFYLVAQHLLQEDSQQNSVDGIVVNPGTSNLFVNKNWIQRLCDFNAYLEEQKAKAAAEDAKN